MSKRNSLHKIALASVAALGLVACERIDPGHVGIKVNLYGDDRGVEQREVLSPGTYWMGWSYRMYEFPTFEQNRIFTKQDNKDSPGDESIYFQSIEGMQLSVDVGLQYQVERAKVPVLFERYRRGIDEISTIYLRNMIRDSIVSNASKMTVEDIIGRKKTELVQKVEDDIRRLGAETGINIRNISFISEIRVPQEVTVAINAKLRAGQIALQRETEVQEAKAAAQKVIEAAKGEVESTRMRAEADATALNIRGEALRKNPEIVQLEAINKWNGVLPTFMGTSAIPFMALPQPK